MPKTKSSGWEKNATPGIQNPRIPKPRNRGLAGAPPVRKSAVASKQTYRTYPPMPAWWESQYGGPETEWIVFWYLTQKKRWQEDKDFYYQSALFLPQFYFSRDFTRADFLIDLGHGSAAGALAGYQGLVLDPITPFTHPSPAFDMARRAALQAQEYLLIFIEGEDLENRTEHVIEQALRGIDESSRGTGAL